MIKIEEQDIHINTGFLPATGGGGGEGGASMAKDVSVTTTSFQVITGKNVQSALGQVDTKLALNEDYDSILLSLDPLETHIGAISQVPVQSLQTQMHDGRPSHKASGSIVYDEFGTYGVIDTIEGQTANIATLTKAGGGISAPKVIEDLASVTPTIANAIPNTVYKFGTINSLTVTTIPDNTLGITILFTAGTSKPTINLPSTLETINFVEFEASKKYAIAIENNIAVMGVID